MSGLFTLMKPNNRFVLYNSTTKEYTVYEGKKILAVYEAHPEQQPTLVELEYIRTSEPPKEKA